MDLFKKLFSFKPEKPVLDKSTPTQDKGMQTLPSSMVVEPFSKINYWQLPNGSKQVRAYFLMEQTIEGAQTGMAIDGSASMQGPFGCLLLGDATPYIEEYKKRGLVQVVEKDSRQYNNWSGQAVTELIERKVFRRTDNIVEPQARNMTEYLTKFDADGGTTVIYWAVGNGNEIEVVGDLRGEECATFKFTGPKDFGKATHLLPAVRYFVERFVEADWGIYVFITDGRLDDLAAVKKYCIDLAHKIERGERNKLKLVMVGIGEEIDEAQMEELDDLETGTEVDLWDHKIAKDMKNLAEIFAEVVSESVIIVPNDGVIRDANRNVIKDYRDTGLPALMTFDLPADSDWFTLEVAGQTVAQKIHL